MKTGSFAQVVKQAADLAALKAAPYDCQCSRTEIRERTIRGGSKKFVRQCLDCGDSVGSPVKQFGEVPLFDETLRERKTKEREAIREQVRKRESADWWNSYNTYLASNAWRDLRVKVLERDNYVCQGCLDAKATQVHHRTYEHVTAEFAFELVSLCNPCHERMHADAD